MIVSLLTESFLSQILFADWRYTLLSIDNSKYVWTSKHFNFWKQFGLLWLSNKCNWHEELVDKIWLCTMTSFNELIRTGVGRLVCFRISPYELSVWIFRPLSSCRNSDVLCLQMLWEMWWESCELLKKTGNESLFGELLDFWYHCFYHRSWPVTHWSYILTSLYWRYSELSQNLQWLLIRQYHFSCGTFKWDFRH